MRSFVSGGDARNPQRSDEVRTLRDLSGEPFGTLPTGDSHPFNPRFLQRDLLVRRIDQDEREEDRSFRTRIEIPGTDEQRSLRVPSAADFRILEGHLGF